MVNIILLCDVDWPYTPVLNLLNSLYLVLTCIQHFEIGVQIKIHIWIWLWSNLPDHLQKQSGTRCVGMFCKCRRIQTMNHLIVIIQPSKIIDSGHKYVFKKNKKYYFERMCLKSFKYREGPGNLVNMWTHWTDKSHIFIPCVDACLGTIRTKDTL